MFTKEKIDNGRFTHTYRVYNIQGMTDEQVLDACDRNNFGGYVTRDHEGNGWAKVYID